MIERSKQAGLCPDPPGAKPLDLSCEGEMTKGAYSEVATSW
jgi:hypothetical protein